MIARTPALTVQDSPINNDEPAEATERWTIQRLLQWTTHYLRGRGSSTPRLDTEVLLAEAIGCPRIDLYARFDQEPSPEAKATFRGWVQRRAKGEPVAYLVGHREFYSLPLRVTPHVLIPRPETEHIVVEAIDLVKRTWPDSQDVRIVDVGTGSGNIALALARHISQARLVATDIDPAALQVAKENAERLELADRIDFRQGDLLAAASRDEQFELVVSNPPYVGRDESDQLDTSVREFEPHTALFSEGPHGSETIARLVPQAAERLANGGYLLIEISPMIATTVLELIAENGSFEKPRIIRDLAGKDRVVAARKTIS